MNERADYRNGKYEGQMNGAKQRHGLGVFIDDDLTFYVSHWSENRINGLSLIYISHGKYIYGEWKNNEPHGLTVFRSGDTVLVGRCRNGRPVSKCLVIFEKFNFACILQEAGDSWNIIQSGQLVSYETLVKYIELIEAPVPDHFFSLTKFACHFSKNSPHIKTFPCQLNCCYFGYSNGLAIIFNSTNGLISIGAHQNEQLSEFGGRYDGARSVEEGNFEEGGERVRYSGERPASKIYAIFQKVHKKSLNFRNEYFDSKIKYFSSIEELLKSKLQQITNECRKTKSMKNVDLNDSLEYQDYTEEESFKINSIRENLYEPVSIQAFTPSERNDSFKQSEEKAMNPKYFRKNTEHSPFTKQKEEPMTFIQNVKQPKEVDLQTTYNAKKSFVKEPAELFYDNPRKSHMANGNRLNIQTIQTKDGQYLDDLVAEQPFTPSKLKEKMRSNNLRYINSQQLEHPIEEKKEKGTSIVKSNTIYKEIKSSKKAEESQPLACKELQNSQETENYRVPNFNCLQIDTEKSKIQENPRNIKNGKPSQKDFYPQTKNYVKKAAEPERGIYDKPKASPYRNQYTPTKQEQELQPARSKRQFKDISVSPRKSIEVSNLSKPNYEDIEERRKRILKEYQDLNQAKPKEEPKFRLPEEREVKIDSPCHNLVFSLSKEEQSSFGYMPITVSEKYSQPTSKPTPKQDNYVLIERENYGEKNIPPKKQEKPSKLKGYEDKSKAANHILLEDPAPKIENQAKVKNNSQNYINYPKSGSTPQRIRKNYQYIYQ